MSNIRVADAIVLASSRGIVVSLVHVFCERRRDVRVGLTTIDPDPLVTMTSREGKEAWLTHREQTGPERWDYPVHDVELQDSLELRLSAGAVVETLSLRPAPFTVIEEQGVHWDIPTPVHAFIDRSTFEKALETLTPLRNSHDDAY